MFHPTPPGNGRWSGGRFRSIENGFEEDGTGVVQPLRGVIITHGGGLDIELCEGDLRLQELVSLVQWGLSLSEGRDSNGV